MDNTTTDPTLKMIVPRLRFEQDSNGAVHLLFRTYDGITAQELAWQEVQSELERIRKMLFPLIDRETRVTIDNATKIKLAQMADQLAARSLTRVATPLAALKLEKELFVYAIGQEMTNDGSTVH
jgi:hypothetical protein